MTDKQYADIETMMMFGRIFADQMYQCLKNTGLLAEGYQMQLYVGQRVGDIRNSFVEIEKNIVDVGYLNWKEESARHTRNEGEEWHVSFDPKAETGSVPPEVHIRKETRNVKETVGATANKPYPPDGLWIGSFNHDSDVDGGQ